MFNLNQIREYEFMKKRSVLGLQAEVNHVANLLNISAPKIKIVDYLQENNKNKIVVRKSKDELTSGIVHGATLIRSKKLLLSRVLPVFDVSTHSFKIEEATYADQLFYMTHCLRKEWQKRHPFSFKNETDADIDADAFAMAFAFTSPYLIKPQEFITSLPFFALKESLHSSVKLDELGTKKYESRWEKAKEICNEYSFTTTIPLDDAKKYISKDNTVFYKSLMLTCGMPL